VDPAFWLLVPAFLGLLGFFEPCSLGASLLALRHLDGKGRAQMISELVVFVATRTAALGLLGAAAALIGQAFTGFQQGMWVVLGALYVLLGVLLLAGRTDLAARLVPLSGPRWQGRRGAAMLGLALGLGMPACAAPLLFALFGLAASQGASGWEMAYGAVSLAAFGFFLSAPLLLAALWPPLRRLMERAVSWAAGASKAAGGVLVAVGLWSIAMGFLVNLENWA